MLGLARRGTSCHVEVSGSTIDMVPHTWDQASLAQLCRPRTDRLWRPLVTSRPAAINFCACVSIIRNGIGVEYNLSAYHSCLYTFDPTVPTSAIIHAGLC